MDRPYIVCHMVASIDGKVTGEFLGHPACQKATELYYELNRSLPADGFICGRVTMEGSFTGGWYPDLAAYPPEEKADFIPALPEKRYAIAFDTVGKLGWKANCIIDPDGDPGYDGARIIEVLSEQTDGRYLGYLKAKNIPYIFAGKDTIDVPLALSKLRKMGLQTLLLEGGSIINGAFYRAGCVDEVSLVVAPVEGAPEDKPLFMGGTIAGFELLGSREQEGALCLRYKKQ